MVVDEKIGSRMKRQYDAEFIKSYYDEYGKREWDRWDVSVVEEVKFAVHLHYLQTRLKSQDRILEIGAGAGRFTKELAQITNHIVVADISPVQLKLNEEYGELMGFGDAVEKRVACDICDLTGHFEDNAFDAVVCYGGPLSYVFDQRSAALAELKRVTKPGGLLFLGVMSLWGTVHQAFPQVLSVQSATNKRIIATGDLIPDEHMTSRHSCHLFRGQEFRQFIEAGGLNIEILSASNCLSTTWGEILLETKKEAGLWTEMLNMELEACREAGCVDMGTHLIAVCSKPA